MAQVATIEQPSKTTVTNPFVLHLMQVQTLAQWTDYTVAKLLKVNRATWSLLRRGKVKNPPPAFLTAYAAMFPEAWTAYANGAESNE